MFKLIRPAFSKLERNILKPLPLRPFPDISNYLRFVKTEAAYAILTAHLTSNPSPARTIFFKLLNLNAFKVISLIITPVAYEQGLYGFGSFIINFFSILNAFPCNVYYAKASMVSGPNEFPIIPNP
jgi:hypothetical protein